MFDVGFNELVLIFIIGLLVLGPQRLPKVAAEVGKWVGRARRTAAELRRQLEREIELNDIQPPPPPPPPSSAETQNPFHHMPADTGEPPPTAEAPPATSTAPPAGAPESPAAAPTTETTSATPVAGASSGTAGTAHEAPKQPEPTDRPPHA